MLKKGLLNKIESDAQNVRIEKTAELQLETREEANEDRPEVTAAFELQVLKTAMETQLKRKEGLSLISLDTGKVTPGVVKEDSFSDFSQNSVNNSKGDLQTEHQTLERIRTGVPGLDEQAEGGFVRKSVNLITGSPGAGKTILAVQFLMQGISINESCLYISFEEKKENFYKYMLQFGWDLQANENKGLFTFLRYSPEQVNKLLEEGGGFVDNIVRTNSVKRICIDSISAFTLLFKDELAARESLLALFDLISRWGATTIVTAEQEAEPEKHTPSVVEFEVDSVISLYNFRRKNIRQRVAEIIKMRGTKFVQKVFPMKIDDHGITFYPEEEAF